MLNGSGSTNGGASGSKSAGLNISTPNNQPVGANIVGSGAASGNGTATSSGSNAAVSGNGNAAANGSVTTRK
jgi:hypothetical protein